MPHLGCLLGTLVHQLASVLAVECAAGQRWLLPSCAGLSHEMSYVLDKFSAADSIVIRREVDRGKTVSVPSA